MYLSGDHCNDQCPAANPGSANSHINPTDLYVSHRTIIVTAPIGTGMTYSIGGAYQLSMTFSALVPGPYTVTAMNSEGCISLGTSVTINTAPGAPASANSHINPTDLYVSHRNDHRYGAHWHRYDL